MRIRSRLVVYLFLILCGLLISRIGLALDAPWTSSTTATADPLGALCGQFIYNGTTVPAQAWIHAVITDSATAGSSIQLYDSSFTITSTTSSLTIGPIMTQTVTAPLMLDVVFRHGLCYVKTSNAVATILYSCF